MARMMSKSRPAQTSETASKPLVGVLALQGDFREHAKMLTELGAEAREVRLPADLDGLDGLIIPGGESTTIGKLMVAYDLQGPLRELIAAGVPVWGTCAGLILLARETDNALAGQPLLASMHIRVRRNAFGSQGESFEADLKVPCWASQIFTPSLFAALRWSAWRQAWRCWRGWRTARWWRCARGRCWARLFTRR
jgi:5'-phosphate synthase pdxT subunit